MTLTGEQLVAAFFLYTFIVVIAAIPITAVYFAIKSVSSKRSEIDVFELYRAHIKMYRERGIQFRVKVAYDDARPTAVQYKGDEDPFDIINQTAKEKCAKKVDVSIEPIVATERVGVRICLTKEHSYNSGECC